MDELELFTDDSLSVSEAEGHESMVYRNPVLDFIHIKTSRFIKIGIGFFYRGKFLTKAQNTNEIFVVHLSKGGYFIKIIDVQNQVKILLFIKK